MAKVENYECAHEIHICCSGKCEKNGSERMPHPVCELCVCRVPVTQQYTKLLVSCIKCIKFVSVCGVCLANGRKLKYVTYYNQIT